MHAPSFRRRSRVDRAALRTLGLGLLAAGVVLGLATTSDPGELAMRFAYAVVGTALLGLVLAVVRRELRLTKDRGAGAATKPTRRP